MSSEHVTRDGVTIEPVGNGVSRVYWTDEVQASDFATAVGAVSALVELALTDLKQARVEAWVDPNDQKATRIATWAGLHREGLMRGVVDLDGDRHDRLLLARVEDDAPVQEAHGFRALLNSFLPRKRAISQMLIRDHDARVLMCQLTYKHDWDLPGGVVEVGESPQLAVSREVHEELGLEMEAGRLLLTDWLPPWGGWDDALCLVFDGGAWDASVTHNLVLQAREIRSAEFFSVEEIEDRAADFTARRIKAALANLEALAAPYTESGRAHTDTDD